MTYLWIKAFHVIAVMAWMAGMLYLPRLFVYHTQCQPGSEASEMLKVMERRLVNAIMTPAAIVSWALGLTLAITSGLYTEIWFMIKFVLVLGMTHAHMMLIRCKNAFARDQNTHSTKFFRIINEVPTLLMIGIIILVITKPI